MEESLSSAQVASQVTSQVASLETVSAEPTRADIPQSEIRAPVCDVGFIGLGRMGSAMAQNLAEAGFRVTAHVRRPERMRALEQVNIKPTADIGDVFDCDVVITMLPDDEAVREVVFGDNGLAMNLIPGGIHLSMSTISTTVAAEVAAAHAQYSEGYVAAPVFGNPDAAKARELFIIAAGAPADVERCRPLFNSLGRQVFIVDTNPPAANLIKLAGNMLVATTLEMLGETMALLRKRSIDPETFLQLLTRSLFGGRVHTIYGRKIVSGQFSMPGFSLPLALKDVRLALAEAEGAAVPMPSVSVVRDRLIAGLARGYAGLDWSALGLIAAEEAGLQPSIAKDAA